jgi:hypothetical protein
MIHSETHATQFSDNLVRFNNSTDSTTCSKKILTYHNIQLPHIFEYHRVSFDLLSIPRNILLFGIR